MRPAPTPIEKNAWPIADRNVPAVTSEKSGCSRKALEAAKSPITLA